MCNCCDSTTQEADLAEDLVVDGETVECVKVRISIVYRGTLSS